MYTTETLQITQETEPPSPARWPSQKIYEWQKEQGWIVGCNYIPGTAINQLEMWQPDTFDADCINKELIWAEEIGFNSIRVFLHHLLWEQDPHGFLERIDKFLTIADHHNIKTMFVLFDAVWNPYPKLGKQPEPKINVHNSGWVQCPGADILKNKDSYDMLRHYVEGIVKNFKNDKRVLVWDVFNEPDNTNIDSYKDESYGEEKAFLSMKLLEKAFHWIREIDPVQPLTAAPWKDDWSDPSKISLLDNYMFNQSDLISFHCYENKAELEKRLNALKQYNRPLVCTEYMARHLRSTFQEVLPLLYRYETGAYNWGLVSGKTQTHCPWDSWQNKYESEPEVWFHDIFRPSGEPYDINEVIFLKEMLKHESQKVA